MGSRTCAEAVMCRVFKKHTGLGVHISPLQIVVVSLDLSEDQTLFRSYLAIVLANGILGGEFLAPALGPHSPTANNLF